ncbi:MAG: hypothetical protein U0529_13310 [Thermoanaerobaculia bacterium]
MKLRETLLGLLVLALLAGGAWWARGRGRAAAPSGVPATAAKAVSPAAPLPDVTLADGSVDLGDVRLVLSADRPVVAFAKARFRVRAEAAGAPVALENGRLSFEMTMPMGDHRYALVPSADGWQEAEVFLPMCRSGNRTWFATVEGTVAGKPRTAMFRLDLAPPSTPPAR